MRERTLQIGPYARHVSQILRLAVADIQAVEYAEDLARALRRQRDIVPDEQSGIELGIIGAAAAEIAAEQGDLELLRHVDAGVLQERGQVVGRRTHQGVLEIEEPYPLELAALRQPEQVRRMDVAQDPGGSRIDPRLQRLAPERLERRARLLGDRRAEPRQVPVKEQLGFDQERADVVGRYLVLDVRCDRQRVRQPTVVQREQHVDDSLVALGDRRRRVARDQALLTQILEQEQPLFEIGVKDLRRRKALFPQPFRHRHEWRDRLGEVSDRAVRLAAAHRRAIRPTRCIHQDTALVAGEELVVGTGRSVAGHATAPRLTHAALRDEVTYRRYPLDARRK